MGERSAEGRPSCGDEPVSFSDFDHHHCEVESVSVSNCGQNTTVLERLVQESLAVSVMLGARFAKQEAALSEVLKIVAAKKSRHVAYKGEDPGATSDLPCPPIIGLPPRRPCNSPLGVVESSWLPADASGPSTNSEPSQTQETFASRELGTGLPKHTYVDSEAQQQTRLVHRPHLPCLMQQSSMPLAEAKESIRLCSRVSIQSTTTEDQPALNSPCSAMDDPSMQDRALHPDSRASKHSFSEEGFGSGEDNNGGSDFEIFARPSRTTIRAIRQIRRSTSSLSSLPETLKASGPKFIRSDCFDYIMGCVLALNAVATGVQVNGMASRNPDPNFLDVSEALDWIFAGIFSVELILRMIAYGREFFNKDDWKWNVFDIIIVVFQIMELIAKHSASGSAVSDAVDNLGILRLLRVGRLARLVRMVRLIPELKSMVYLVLASLGSFVWAALLMFLIMYAFAIYFTEMAVDVRKYATTSSQQEVVYEQWGSIGNSIFSLFMSISGGADWKSFIEVFTYSRNGWTMVNTFVFSLYIAFATLVMLNLVTGVFVEGAHCIVQRERDKDILKMASRAFVFVDSDDSWDITWDEFQAALDSPPMLAYLEAMCMTTHEATQLFCILDTDKSQSLSVDEFVKGCQRLSGQARCLDVAQLRQAHEERFEELQFQIERMHLLLNNFLEVLKTKCGSALNLNLSD
eukprot:TRINITY_DN73462_c0_g1_i1.p1 TRINITY_DN73462_c0_g1~~TRINITY_DN73462_c0_g1_i1.p1  ORF type:complete len:689 (-),score=111.03 TRINITY_DN73462_c0_g1_i1:269-2335(-)